MQTQDTPQTWQVDGPLGTWIGADWRPPALAVQVEKLWAFDGVLNHARERVFPDGSIELIVQLGPCHRSTEGDEHRDGFPRLCFNGQRLRAEVVEAPAARVQVVGLRLTPLGAQALLRGAHTEALDRTVDLELALGAAARALGDALADAPHPAAQLQAAARWLQRELRDAAPPDASVAWVCQRLRETGGQAGIRALCEQAGLSTTRLPARFRALTGLTPKQYARVMRLQAVLALLARDAASPLSELALDAGYADQPHFNAEFKAMAGLTPGDYLRAQRYPNTVSLAEPAPAH
ncbi:helix-turn-helix domain-containing protein [Ideonella azotifigens]|nr:helix-turn-helix domain-containing protein [Ideonella azotifigens]MCD2342409.1 helix-turn-helix domain-containing protein [Ideonella azotifigens]